ncbi:tRNA dimethylallyltransferase, mitochondrial-like, partial [Pseudomyrmex gracilis]|uniref:tRNA dimethylallyltransferase, mitochondrial-like n=1 Tax=Pseudomyrmex gracilis TaxID=219809 RepID=UPI000994A1E8
MAPHHMLDIVDPLTNFTVTDFRNKALPIIDNLLARSKLPIVVGGTNYYIESLLWEILITEPKDRSARAESAPGASVANRSDDRCKDEQNDDDDEDDNDEAAPSKRLKFDARLCGDTNEELHRKLMEVDPEMAHKLHPNNRRKVT